MASEHEQESKPQPAQDVPTERGAGVNRRQFIALSASAFVASILAACGGASPTATTSAPAAAKTTSSSSSSAAATTAASSSAAAAPAGKKGGEFHGAWPFQVPPEGHYNTMNGVPKGGLGLVGGIYRDIMEMPFGMYYWNDKKWMQLLATDQKFEGDNFRVNLRQGVKWSDGKTFTSKDVVSTFMCLWIMRQPVWNFIDDVKADGDYSVLFHMSAPSTVVERYVIRENIRSDATFGDWAKKAQDLKAAGKKLDDPEGKQLNTDFQQYRPKDWIVTGPYKLDPSSITNAQLTLVKNPTSWVADKVAFDKVVLYNGETPDITPVVLARDVDYATHGFPPATEQAFMQAGIRIVRPPTYSGGAVYINFDKIGNFFNDKKARQAIAMAISRDQNAKVTYADSGKAPKYMSGIPDLLTEQWVSKDDLAKFNTYPFDTAKAAQMLTDLGWKKGSDGVWMNKDGARAEFEMLVPAEYADSSASAQDSADQLTKFGIKTTVRTETFTQFPIDLDKGNFQFGLSGWGNSSQTHPQFSYDTALLLHNTRAANNGGKGMAFPLKQKTDSAGDVDLEQLTIDAGKGLDEDKQKEAVTKIAQAFNELLPIIPLYERFGNNPVLQDGDKVRVTGWPADSDTILKNSAYADSFVIMMMLEGKLQPK
jgi:peptide/nickel transport system substrate-binding protein